MARTAELFHDTFAQRDARTDQLFEALFAAEDDIRRNQLIEQIVVMHLDLCGSMAGRYQGRGIEQDDLVQVARLALVKAIHRYRPGRGPSFAAYAVPTISGELKRYFRDRGWMIRPPRRVQELRASLPAQRERLEQLTGRAPTTVDLARAVGASIADVREAASAATSFRPVSLDGSATDDTHPSLVSFLACADPALEAADDHLGLSAALGHLNVEDRRLICMRYVEGMTQRQIGATLGVSQMQVSRRISRVLARLRADLDVVDPVHRPEPAEAG